MEGSHRKAFSIQRTFKIPNKISFHISTVFLILFINVNLSNCYSSVRRSGSISNINEAKILTEKTIPNISPMLRPSITERKAEDIETSTFLNLNNNKSSEETNNTKITDLEYQTFKPLPLDINFKIPIVENVKTGNENTNEKDEVIKQLDDAIDLIENKDNNHEKRKKLTALEEDILGYVDDTLSQDHFKLFEGVNIEPVSTLKARQLNSTSLIGAPRSLNENTENKNEDFDHKIMKKFTDFAKSHKITVNVPETARFFGFRFGNGVKTFLTGFGLGFLAFGLKKLLLPIFIGAQIVKSVLIAMFLPSILGSFGKIIGKGLSQFSGVSTNFGHNEVQAGEDLEDFKEMGGYTDHESETGGYHYPNGGDNVGTLPAHTLYGESSNNINSVAMSRYGPGGAKVTYVPSASNNYYNRLPYKKQEDFKVFHNIPSSSLLLSNYDPFYSPLLSRLDSVFQRLGLRGGTAGSQGASASVERCREKLVCLMYATPAKYAPYSNLVSAQLSRELNELRKPTSDNQEILRFFKYMKAAKNGQEGISCSKVYPGCPSLTADTGTAAMITTYNDINKLVGARKLEG